MADNKYLGNVNVEDADRIIKRDSSSDELIFDFKKICLTTHPLAQIVRYIFACLGMTKTIFKDKHKRMADSTCMPTNKASFDLNNTYRSLIPLDITWTAFEKMLNVMSWDLVDLKIVTRDRDTGEIREWKRSDAIAAIAEDPYPANLMMQRYNSISQMIEPQQEVQTIKVKPHVVNNGENK